MSTKKAYFKFHILCLVFFLMFCPFCFREAGWASSHEQELPPLEELEPLVQEGPEVLSSLALLNENMHILEAEKDSIGPKFYINATYGYNDEPQSETSDENINYQKLTLKSWVSFPILGTWNGEKIKVLKAEMERLKGEALLRKVLETNLTSLRKAYIVLWAECRKEEAIKEFLAGEEEARKVLKARTEKGLLLEADRLEFMSAFEMAKRDLESVQMKKSQALGTIRLATGKSWKLGAKCPNPTLPGPIKDPMTLYDNIPKLADLYYKDQALELREQIAQLSGKLEKEGNIDLGVAVGKDFPGGTGSGAYISATIKNPFRSLRDDKDPAKLAAEEALKKEKQEKIITQITLENDLNRILGLRRYAIKSIDANEKRLEAAKEAIRENLLRHEKIPGDTFEQLLKSRYNYLRTYLDFVDAQSLLLQTEAELAIFAYPVTLDNIKEKLPRYFPLAEQNSLAFPFRLSAYVWDPSALLDAKTRTSELDKLASEGFSRVLLSFSKAELNFLKTPQGKRALLNLIEECKSRAMDVELLLGDPSWLLEKHRPNLLEIIGFMSQFPFDGIHLDIEPDSLPDAAKNRKALAQKLVDTTKEVLSASGFPVSLSIHPRYLEGELGQIAGKGLAGIGVEYVAVMIYSSNAEKTAKRMEAIMKSFPNMRFALAQSVEQNLSPQESYGTKGKTALKEALHYMNKKLQSSQFEGFIIQSWKEYKEMKP